MAVRGERVFCCCSLKIWTRTIGWLGLIVTVSCAFGIPLMTNHMIDMLLKAGRREEAHQLDRYGTGTEFYLSAGLYSAFLVLVDVLLVVGNEKERPSFFLPWMILSWITTALLEIFYFVLLLALLPVALVLLITPIVLTLPAIFLYTVHKRYTEIKAVKADWDREQFQCICCEDYKDNYLSHAVLLHNRATSSSASC